MSSVLIILLIQFCALIFLMLSYDNNFPIWIYNLFQLLHNIPSSVYTIARLTISLSLKFKMFYFFSIIHNNEMWVFVYNDFPLIFSMNFLGDIFISNTTEAEYYSINIYCYTAFKKGYANLHPHLQYRRISVLPYFYSSENCYLKTITLLFWLVKIVYPYCFNLYFFHYEGCWLFLMFFNLLILL